MPSKEPFLTLLNKYKSGTLTPEEEAQFAALLETGEYRNWLAEDVQENFKRRYDEHELQGLSKHRSGEMISAIVGDAGRSMQTEPGAKVYFLKRSWIKYAAAVLIIVASAVYIQYGNRSKMTTNNTVSNASQIDIAPGGEKAILTLADGQEIILDNAANGKLTQQGNAEVVKLSDGQIAYQIKEGDENATFWNTMSTPAGGQYHVKLPDGTGVWLNAKSSITYPTSFTGKERRVKISGEVYFEVAKNKGRAFIVDVNGKSSVQVLGTIFNVNAYENEETINTTLLEGSVKITRKSKSVILKPGEQAKVLSDNSNINNTTLYDKSNEPGVVVISNADTEQILAWKNGLFNFNNADLRAVVRQLERWYDIDVNYEGSLPKTKFSGKIYRNVNLSDVLEALQRMGVKYKMNGKTLVVY